MKKGFTLVELIATIVVLSIILVFAIPKIINVIQEGKKNAFISTAKSIIRQIEYEDNEFESSSLNDLDLGNISTLDIDLEMSIAYINNDEIYLNLVGSNEYEGMYICNISASSKTVIVQSESCQ